MFDVSESLDKLDQFKGRSLKTMCCSSFAVNLKWNLAINSGKNGEIDFVLQNGTEIIPIEAKGGEDKSAPSFKRYIADRRPEHAIRFSKRGYRKDGAITTIPLYLAVNKRAALTKRFPPYPRREPFLVCYIILTWWFKGPCPAPRYRPFRRASER